MNRPTSTPARGAIAGVIGAATLAVWFFIVDALQGAPLQTPAFLASSMAGRSAVETSATLIGMYTALHVVAFVLVGIGVTWLIARVPIRPHFLLGLVLGFLLFDVLFYAGVVITGVNIVRAIGWPEVLIGNLLAGVAMLGYLQATTPGDVPAWGEDLRSNRVIREGVVAGLLGAGAVAVWFLVLDLLQGRALFTPAALGSALFLGAGSSSEVRTTVEIVASYTAVHVFVFLVVGLVAAALVRRAEREPPVLLGAVLLFVTLEAFIIGVIAIIASWLLHVMAWWTIGVANIIAAVVMGAYLWHEHPALRRELAVEDLEEPQMAGGPGTTQVE